MINVLKVRKWGALFFVAFVSVLAYVVGGMYYGFWGGLGFFLASLLISLIVANALLRNAFTSMLEGNGLLVLDVNSTGLISPFVLGLSSPFVVGKFRGKSIQDVFDRNAVGTMSVPTQVADTVVTDSRSGDISFKISNKEYNRGRFAMFHYPVLIYNSQMGKLVTKEFIMTNEKNLLVEHLLLYISNQMESLKMALLNFGRYVVETTKPKSNILQNKWFWIILVGLIVGAVLVVAFPRILGVMKGAGSGMTEAVRSTVG